MRIAILGTRGIPANYGGFETFAEEVSRRLAERGHEVTVYCRSHYAVGAPSFVAGVRRVVLPTVRHKYLDTAFHTFLSSLHALARPYDVVIFCNAANAIFLPIPRLRGSRVLINVDGLEWNRRKWNWLGKFVYRVSEKLACRFADEVVTDAAVIRTYYESKHRRRPALITYGAAIERPEGADSLNRWGLESGRYFLYVGRLEPENNADRVLDAFARVETDLRLVIVGDSPYARGFVRALRRTTDPRVVFTGAIYGLPYRELVTFAYASIHATEVGGTHPALLDALSLGNGVLVNDVPENREVADDVALFFHLRGSGTLVEALRAALARPDELRRRAAAGRERVRRKYDWERVTDHYEQIAQASNLALPNRWTMRR